MAVQLEIEDGDPWYLSQNLMTVPGDDPNGPTDNPVVNESCWLWARVRNQGSHRASDATVRFYWANPAVGFDRTTATVVGSESVTIQGGGVEEVQCPTPWVPSYVNQGHLCVLAEAFHEEDDPLPPDHAFRVPEDRHVAQRNVSVIQLPEQLEVPRFHLPFEVHNPDDERHRFAVRARRIEFDEVANLRELVGQVRLPDQAGDVERLGFVESPCPSPDEYEDPMERLPKVTLAPGARTGYTLVGRLDGEAALVTVTQELNGREVGGLAVLVVRAEQ